jgi:hypothetical protein
MSQQGLSQNHLDLLAKYDTPTICAEDIVLDYLKLEGPIPQGLAEVRDVCAREIEKLKEWVVK